MSLPFVFALGFFLGAIVALPLSMALSARPQYRAAPQRDERQYLPQVRVVEQHLHLYGATARQIEEIERWEQ